MAGAGEASLPKGLVVSDEMAKSLKTYLFSITMRATFPKLTSANHKTAEYIQWTEKIFDEIERVNSDQN